MYTLTVFRMRKTYRPEQTLDEIAVLEGAGFEDILRDEADGETMDRPSGDYTVYRRPPEGGK